jgi:PIN domain nuclease of toxin-antitoxin system
VSQRLLADTSVILWTLEASPRFSARAKRELFDPSTTLIVSVVSLWEIVLKHQSGELLLKTSLGAVLDQIIHDSPWPLLPVMPVHLPKLAALPLLHKDPFDRLLVAQAQCEGLTILTPDQKIRDYDVATLW